MSSSPSHDAAGRPDAGAARACLTDLVERHGRAIEALCRALLRDSAEAEDAAQQAFLSAYRALLNGSVPLDPSAWLATIARNECVARVRTRMRLPVAEQLDVAGSLPDPLAEAIRRSDLDALWAAVAELPAQQREALLLRELSGLRYDELAAALAISEAAVESLLFRARRRLRTALAPLNAAGAVPLALRELLGRLADAAPAAKVAAIPLAAAVATGGVVALRPHRAPVREAASASPPLLVRRPRPAPPVVHGSTSAPRLRRVVASRPMLVRRPRAVVHPAAAPPRHESAPQQDEAEHAAPEPQEADPQREPEAAQPQQGEDRGDDAHGGGDGAGGGDHGEHAQDD